MTILTWSEYEHGTEKDCKGAGTEAPETDMHYDEAIDDFGLNWSSEFCHGLEGQDVYRCEGNDAYGKCVFQRYYGPPCL